jgi:low affinity Fe/Cu permease
VTFIAAILLIVVWCVTGPIFGFSDTWQLVINTGTTIVTFLMVFLIQNTQTRDTEAIHVKLDELIRSVQGAKNSLLDLEEMDEKELEQLHKSYERLGRMARDRLDEVAHPSAGADDEDRSQRKKSRSNS